MIHIAAAIRDAVALTLFI